MPQLLTSMSTVSYTLPSWLVTVPSACTVRQCEHFRVSMTRSVQKGATCSAKALSSWKTSSHPDSHKIQYTYARQEHIGSATDLLSRRSHGTGSISAGHAAFPPMATQPS